VFLSHADAHGAEVVLHCDPRNVPFYRHHGFHLISIRSSAGQHLMLRHARRVPPRMLRDPTRRSDSERGSSRTA
jgi:hypothetical protein